MTPFTNVFLYATNISIKKVSAKIQINHERKTFYFSLFRRFALNNRADVKVFSLFFTGTRVKTFRENRIFCVSRFTQFVSVASSLSIKIYSKLWLVFGFFFLLSSSRQLILFSLFEASNYFIFIVRVFKKGSLIDF